MQEECPGVGEVPRPLRLLFDAGDFDYPRIRVGGTWLPLQGYGVGVSVRIAERLREANLEVAC